jgi:hypothetical protein
MFAGRESVRTFIAGHVAGHQCLTTDSDSARPDPQFSHEV